MKPRLSDRLARRRLMMPAAGVLVVLATIAASVLLLRDDGEAATDANSAEARILLALVGLAPDTEIPPESLPSPHIIVRDVTTGSGQLVGGPASWSSVAFSPDGRYLAAVEGDGTGSRLHLFTRDGWSPRTVDLDGPAAGPPPVWSPDSPKVALVVSGFVRIFSADTTRLAASTGARTSPAQGSSSGIPLWSPDSRRVAVDIDRRLLVLAVDGAQFSVDPGPGITPPGGPPAGGPTPPPGFEPRAQIEGWKDAATLVGFGDQDRTVPVGDGVELVVRGQLPASGRSEYEAETQILRATLPEGVLTTSRLTSDQRGVVLTVLHPRPDDIHAPIAAYVRFAGQNYTVELGPAWRFGGRGVSAAALTAVALGGDAPRMEYRTQD